MVLKLPLSFDGVSSSHFKVGSVFLSGDTVQLENTFLLKKQESKKG